MSGAAPDPGALRAHRLGVIGETQAAEWYEAAGYRVLDRNWRVPGGELDLVVAKGTLTVFCEVKTRRSSAFGVPAAAVTAQKAARIRRLAARWLTAHPVSGRREVRFDVVAILGPGSGSLEVIEEAF